MDAADQIMPVVELDLRPGSPYRERIKAVTDTQYGVVSFPRSGHNRSHGTRYAQSGRLQESTASDIIHDRGSGFGVLSHGLL